MKIPITSFKQCMNILVLIFIVLHTKLCLQHNLSKDEIQQLLHQIQNTRQIIFLYEQKLQILMRIVEQQNITLKVDQLFQPYQKSTSQNTNNISLAQIVNNKNELVKGSAKNKLQQQILFEIDVSNQMKYNVSVQDEDQIYFDEQNRKIKQQESINKGVVWVQPYYFINLFKKQIINLDTKQIKVKSLNADYKIINIQPHQITLWISDSKVKIINFKQQKIQKQLSLKVKHSNKTGKWHHATKFDDIFMQIQGSTLYLSSVSTKQIQLIKMKQNIIDVFSIHQYRVLFVTQFHYGYLNPKSKQFLQQKFLSNNTQKQHKHNAVNLIHIISSHYCHQYGILFVLFNNATIAIIEHDKVVASTEFNMKNIYDQYRNRVDDNRLHMMYLSSGFLFVYAQKGRCFQVFEVSTAGIGKYAITHYKNVQIPAKININNHDSNIQSYKIVKYLYQFYKHNNLYRLLLTAHYQNNEAFSQLYNINLQEKEHQPERSLPWKIILIVLGVVAVVYYKSRKNNNNSNNNNKYGNDIGNKNEQYEALMAAKRKMNKRNSNNSPGFNQNMTKRTNAQKQDSYPQSQYLREIAQIKRNQQKNKEQ